MRKNNAPYYLDYYFPERIQTRGRYLQWRYRILQFKSAYEEAIDMFVNRVGHLIGTDIAIAVVPSSDIRRTRTPLHKLAAEISARWGQVDASSCLRRIRTIQSAHRGGPRDMDIHLSTIIVDNSELFAGRNVLLVDDVITSGNSMAACQQLLLRTGATSVWCLALGRTASRAVEETKTKGPRQMRNKTASAVKDKSSKRRK